ncbi:MAG: fatty acid--CoA ligase, partial [Pseudomonadota bacterium]|nr:fatty acid--CoA ligase [Pseudomonadota bacterium]
YAVPDERLGEEVGATLYTERDLSDEELRDFLSERLAKFKIPTYVWQHREPLPRTASGKIFKRELRQQAVARAGA